jgi:hypothetical protein
MRKGANDFQSASLSLIGSSATGAGKDELFELCIRREMRERTVPSGTFRKFNVSAPISDSIESFAC